MDYVLDGYCGACPIMLETKAGKAGEDKHCYGCKTPDIVSPATSRLALNTKAMNSVINMVN
jgi:hypothetical protein